METVTTTIHPEINLKGNIPKVKDSVTKYGTGTKTGLYKTLMIWYHWYPIPYRTNEIQIHKFREPWRAQEVRCCAVCPTCSSVVDPDPDQ
jgi:hypothetical protein